MSEDIRVPVFLMTGFLESGKTDFLLYTMEQDYFAVEGTTLLIVCEEGELEYEDDYLETNRIKMEVIEDPEDFTTEKLQEFEDKYHPEQVVIEYNGMWQMKVYNDCQLPADWGLTQQVTMVDASTFQLYLNNMKSLFMDMARDSDLIIFNRADKSMPLDNYRRGIAIANPKAVIVFEDSEGEQIEDIYDGKMPFDVDADPIEIEPIDYGMWYMDVSDNPERYDGKMVHFQAKVWKSKKFGPGVIAPGRMAMTCCADDTTFISYICHTKYADKLKHGQWIDLTAQVRWEHSSYYDEEGPVLYAKHIKVIPPLENEMIYFN